MSAFARLNLFDRMRLWQKFLLLGAFATLAAAVPFVSVMKTTQEAISFAREEQTGLPPVMSLIKAVQVVQQHLGLSSSVLGGNRGDTQPRLAKEAEVNQIFADSERLLGAALESNTAIKDRFAQIRQNWRDLAQRVANGSADNGASLQAHKDLLERLLVLVELAADHYKLSLDPYAHTYFLIQAVTNHLPQTSEAFGQVRATGVAWLAEAERTRAGARREGAMAGTGALAAGDRSQMRALLSAAGSSYEAAFRFLDKAMAIEPRVRERLATHTAAPRAASAKLVALAQKELVEAGELGYDPGAFYKAYTDGIDAQFQLMTVAGQLLQAELDQVVAERRSEQFTYAAETIAAFVLAALVGLLIVLSVRRTVARLQASVDAVRTGKDAELLDVGVRDEVGDLGRTVNQLLAERMEAQRKAEGETERLNNSVISILQAVSRLSQRDLTARAPVTEDVIGTVSDSINALTDETSRVLVGVNQIADQVADVSRQVRAQAEAVSRTAEDERASVGRMVETLADATQTMNRVAALAEQSNAAAEQATAVTDTALETVNGTVKGMESIRETIAETEKRIKRLGERSQEITGIVNMINTISERTHVLALNASMQAAVAGDAGRGFAVVAEEVQRLAESSRNATQQIAALVGNIQLETNETINTVNRTISQVVAGSELAQKAGDQMRRTQSITAELVAQVRRIAESSEQQKDASAQLLTSVQSIGQSTELTAQQIEQQNRQTETLLASSRQLVDSVRVFKLPETV